MSLNARFWKMGAIPQQTAAKDANNNPYPKENASDMIRQNDSAYTILLNKVLGRKKILET
jgi:hypothetical protein